jgi:hypothetical protein
MRYLLFCSFFLPWLTSCQNDEVGRNNAAEEDGLYYDYQVSAEEGREEATMRLQYKDGDENGETLAMEKPAKVLFDGAELAADSSRFTGTYYELIKPVAELSGGHSIVFIDAKGGEHKVEFSFQLFSLVEELPGRMPARPFTIHFSDFPSSPTTVRVVMTDTSLQSAGVNEELLVEEGTLTIDESLLNHLTEGPVTMEISREEIQPIQTLAGEKGRLLLSYALRRQFELVR